MSKKVLLTMIGSTQAGSKPISNSIIAAVLKEKGHEVVQFDTTFMDIGFPLDSDMVSKLKQFKHIDYGKYNLKIDKSIDPEKAFLEMVEREEPDVIFASTMTDMFPYTCDFIRLAKEKRSINAVMGGIHPTLNPQECIDTDCIDAICIGEGEGAIIDYLDNLDGTRVKQTSIENLWIKQDGEIYKNPTRPLVDMDSLPFLDYSIYDPRHFHRAYMGKMMVGGDVQESRGCPKKCSYCANAILNTEIYARSRIARFSPEHFVEESEFLQKTWGINFSKFHSEDIGAVNVDTLAKLSDLYRRKVNIPFTSSAHPKSLTKRKLRLLKEMNCASLSIAMECGDEDYRTNVLARTYTNDVFKERIAWANEAGIRTYVLTMIGLPYESRHMIDKTIYHARDSDPGGCHCHVFFPYRGTPLGDLAIKEKFVDTQDLIRRGVRYHREFTCLKMPQIEPAEIEGIRRMWHYYMDSYKFLYPIIKYCERMDNRLKKGLIKVVDIMTEIRMFFKGRGLPGFAPRRFL